MSVVEFSADAWQASSPGLQKGLARRITAVSELLQGFDALAASDKVTGQGADAMRAYIGEVHLPILQSLLISLSTFQTAIGVYWNGYAQVDSDGNFRLVNDEYGTHLARLDRGMEQLRGFSVQLRQIAGDASHLVSLGGAGAVAAEQAVNELQGMHSIVKGQKETWEAYEASDPGFAQVRSLIAELGRIVKNVGALTVGQGRSYTAGSFTLTLQQLGPLTSGMVEYCQQNQKVASDGWRDMFSKLVKDVEAADKARREQAGWDLIWDGLQIVAGAVITVIGLGLTPFTGGFSLGLTLLGGSLLIGGINSAINHVSIATTGNELNLVGMAGKAVSDWWDANAVKPAADSGWWSLQFLAGVGSGVIHTISDAGQLNVHEAGMALTVLVTDPRALAELWNQITTTVGQVAGFNPSVIGQLAGALLPGAAALKAARAAGLVGEAGELAGVGKPIKTLPVPVPSPNELQDLKSALIDATRGKQLPGYDPTGGLGWDRFLDTYLNGFDDKGRPQWNWPDDPPHTNGFTNGISKPSDLVPGDTLERITFKGKDGEPVDGSFAAPPGTAFDQLSLPPDRLGGNTTVVRYEILKPLPDNVRMGEIAPGFGQPGLGTQYHFPVGIQKLIEQGYLKEIS
ncbi:MULTISPECIES: glycohydrolase toxin TNT-related protein [unclassified Leifsonia]|uniref:glycohydrolase toxin TNT-related protein n=1 Tax=unclassified Leifsonia TaxID=2663824 RepID=UPI0008A74909|nr:MULTISPECIES: glycohydrolase toxin TNT-related protein [unclassified Leifsonia]SEI17751.1 LXG domain of WXG superfamily protein [Leifsonia sp. CL154]SFM11253.1 LXG domain of WXG superfamily protein [Leifsonia sp. CL147]